MKGLNVRSAGHFVAAVAVSFGLAGMGGGAATAQSSIGPDQHFAGLVNDVKANAQVRTVCAGPGSTGSVEGGQNMSIEKVRKHHGYTGPSSSVYAWFVPSSTNTRPVQLNFATYNTPQSIPTSVHVPCNGSGQVEFSSCPYLAPCAYGWVPEYVDVTFVDIAA